MRPSSFGQSRALCMLQLPGIINHSCFIGIETVRCENAAQVALHAAIRPLLRLEDGHVLATLSAVVLALCEGRTGLAICGVFGAGKTRSAAVLLAGLLVFDPEP